MPRLSARRPSIRRASPSAGRSARSTKGSAIAALTAAVTGSARANGFASGLRTMKRAGAEHEGRGGERHEAETLGDPPSAPRAQPVDQGGQRETEHERQSGGGKCYAEAARGGGPEGGRKAREHRRRAIDDDGPERKAGEQRQRHEDDGVHRAQAGARGVPTLDRRAGTSTEDGFSGHSEGQCRDGGAEGELDKREERGAGQVEIEAHGLVDREFDGGGAQTPPSVSATAKDVMQSRKTRTKAPGTIPRSIGSSIWRNVSPGRKSSWAARRNCSPGMVVQPWSIRRVTSGTLKNTCARTTPVRP